jgi:hypothetical protein
MALGSGHLVPRKSANGFADADVTVIEIVSQPQHLLRRPIALNTGSGLEKAIPSVPACIELSLWAVMILTYNSGATTAVIAALCVFSRFFTRTLPSAGAKMEKLSGSAVACVDATTPA